MRRSRDIQVVALSCGQCAAGLPAIDGDVVFLCAECGHAQELVEESGQLRPVKVEFARPKVQHPGLLFYLPFYVLEFEEPISFLKAGAARKMKLAGQLFDRESEPKLRFQRVFVPGWNSASANVVGDVSAHFNDRQIEYETAKPDVLLGCSRTAAEARQMLETCLLQSVVKCNGLVETLELGVEIERHTLLGVPFFHAGQFVVDGFCGFKYPVNYREHLDEIIEFSRTIREKHGDRRPRGPAASS